MTFQVFLQSFHNFLRLLNCQFYFLWKMFEELLGQELVLARLVSQLCHHSSESPLSAPLLLPLLLLLVPLAGGVFTRESPQSPGVLLLQLPPLSDIFAAGLTQEDIIDGNLEVTSLCCHQL